MINFAITKYSDEVFVESLQSAQNLLKRNVNNSKYDIP